MYRLVRRFHLLPTYPVLFDAATHFPRRSLTSRKPLPSEFVPPPIDAMSGTGQRTESYLSKRLAKQLTKSQKKINTLSTKEIEKVFHMLFRLSFITALSTISFHIGYGIVLYTQAIAFVSARGYTIVDTPRNFTVRLEKTHEIHGRVVVHFDSWDVSTVSFIWLCFG